MSPQELRSKLERIESDLLAALLVQLADEDDGIRERVEALALRADPTAYRHALRQRLDRFKRGRRFIHYRESSAFARQLEAWLDDLEEELADQMLIEGRSRACRHAMRYVDRLASLDGRVNDYRGLPDHMGYLAQLREQHGRKRSFWHLLQG